MIQEAARLARQGRVEEAAGWLVEEAQICAQPELRVTAGVLLREAGLNAEVETYFKEEEQFLAPFFAQAENGEIATVAQIQYAFEALVGHEVDESTIYRLLSRHGWRKLMPRPKHPKADPHIQEQFKASFSAQVEAVVVTREVGDERPVLIMAQDEGRFGRISRVKRSWAPPGMRPHVSTQVVREYTYVYAAVAPDLGQMVSLILPEASTEMMNLFLEQVSQTFSKHFIVMQVDGAGWHRAHDLVIPENIRLIPQPAYSPERGSS